MWIFNIIEWVGDAIKWGLDNIIYVVVGVAFIFSGLLRRFYRFVKRSIIETFSLQGLISFAISIVLLLYLLAKFALL